MQDGYDFDYVFCDESASWPSVSEMQQSLISELAIHELSKMLSKAISSLGDALNRLLWIAPVSLEEIMEMIATFAEECAINDSDSESYPKVVTCYIHKSAPLFHGARIPWFTSGFL